MTTEIVESISDQSETVLSVISRAARDPSVDIVKLEALLRLQREITAEDAKAQFVRALHSAKSKIPAVEKNGTIDLGKGRPIPFTRYEDVMAVVQPILDEYGLTIGFDTQDRDGGGLIVVGTLTHVAGHSKTARLSLPADNGPGRNPLQSIGSTLSYGQRYVVEMLLNVVRKGQDDDGAAGGTKVITLDEVKNIEDLLDETASDHTAFLRFVGAPNIESIQHKDYAKAINALMDKKRKTTP